MGASSCGRRCSRAGRSPAASSAWRNRRRSAALPSPRVALRTCAVTFTDHRGARHTVEVSAESLFEAAALGLGQLRACDWLDVIGPAARLEVEVKAVPVRHEISVAHVLRWCESSAANPDERIRKDRVKRLLD